ncbi:ATP-binding cassette domain-containing protein [Pseudonocardia tropica]|uniref:ATP-binding cassette domain-containing protein n=1 Tax=Pseudonocardia tropica TaxID=681289 RepID=A0ABV1K1M5_9PSEU
MTPAIRTQRLSKVYGDRTVVADLDLNVPTGCVYGFLGPNGSGKTTTMKMILSLVRPSRGAIELMGRPLDRSTRRSLLRRVGSLIEAPPGYGHLTGGENMRVVQRLLGLSDRQVTRAVETVRLRDHLGRKVGTYSLGMKQRLGIAMALAREPALLLLDEPTNGLDPAGIEEIRDLLSALAAAGTTVMVSSHLLGEIDRTATVLGILGGGRLLFEGPREDLLARSAPEVLFETSDPRHAASLVAPHHRVRIDGATVRVRGVDHRATARIVAALVRHGVDVHGVSRERRSLEDVFRDLTGGRGL